MPRKIKRNKKYDFIVYKTGTVKDERHKMELADKTKIPNFKIVFNKNKYKLFIANKIQK